MARRKRAAAAPTSSTPKTRMELRESLLLRGDVRLGDVMAPWQRADFEAMDDPAVTRWYYERPRGWSKTSDVGTEIVAELLMGPREGEIISVAMDEDQAQILFQDVAAKLRRGGYEARAAVQILKNKITSIHTGTTYVAMPSDAPSAWGLRPTMVAYDEIEEVVRRELWDALYSSVIKNKGAKVLVIGTAGVRKDSLAWELRSHAEHEPGWCLRVRGPVVGDATPPWIDAVAMAEQKRLLPAHVFARLHENRWVDSVGAWLTYQQVEGVFVHGAPGGEGQRVVAVDIGVRRDRSVAVVERLDADGIYTIETMISWVPPDGGEVDLQDVERVVDGLARKHRCPIVMDPWQGALMAQRIMSRPKGPMVHVDPISESVRNGLFLHLRDVVVERRLMAEPNPMFREELLGMEFEMRPGARYRVNHGAGRHDDHVFAVGLGAYWLGKDLAPPKRKPLEGHRYDGPSNYRPAVASPTPSTHPDGIAAPGYKLCPGCDHAKPHAAFELKTTAAFWTERDLAEFCLACTAAKITVPKKPPNLGPHGDGTWRIYLREARGAGGAIVSRRDFGNPRDPAIKHWRENFITRCEGGRWLDDSEIVAATKENAA